MITHQFFLIQLSSIHEKNSIWKELNFGCGIIFKAIKITFLDYY